MNIESLCLSFASVFLRFFTSLLFVPFGLLAKFGLAFFLALFTSPLISAQSLTPLSDLLNGLSIGIGLFTPIIVARIAIELIENMRGVNLALIFNPFTQRPAYIIEYAALIVLVVMLQAGVFEELIVSVVNSFQLDQAENLPKLLTQVEVAVKKGFEVVMLPACLFLLVELTFLWLGRVLPGVAFFSEIFLFKFLIFLSFLRH